ncbi:MAG TPA: porin [Xanthomonadales bacterium]|nr:porin [Xanthomonadales bacterium]
MFCQAFDLIESRLAELNAGARTGASVLVMALALFSPWANAQQTVQDRLQHPIHSVLLEKESPLLGFRWGGEIFVDVPLNDEPAGADLTLRKAKLKFHRKLGTNWQVKLSADYNKGGDLEINDSYAVYTGWPRALLKLGFTKPAFSLESVSGAASQVFMEEALPVAALSERRAGGVNWLRRTSNSIINGAILVFNPEQDGQSNSGQALVLHYVHSPIDFAGRKGVNIGGSFSYRVNVDSKDTQFRSRPEIGTSNTRFVDTGEISDADKIIKFGLEASQVRGRFSWQQEIVAAQVERNSSPTVSFWGVYVLGSWFLTNDSRNFDLGQGRFRPQKVSSPMFKGGKGAWEVAVRASYVDLSDADVNGGSETNLTLGLNWYLNDDIRLMGNVVKVVDVDRPGNEFDGVDPLIVAVRAQWLIN